MSINMQLIEEIMNSTSIINNEGNLTESLQNKIDYASLGLLMKMNNTMDLSFTKDLKNLLEIKSNNISEAIINDISVITGKIKIFKIFKIKKNCMNKCQQEKFQLTRKFLNWKIWHFIP